MTRDPDLQPQTPGSQPGNPPGAHGAEHSLHRGRRQFLRKAAATAPVILTLTSRPVWGNTCSPSGNCSGNASMAGDPEPCPIGLTPDGWLSPGLSWPGGYDRNDTFEAVFGIPLLTGSGDPAKLHQVLRNAGGHYGELAPAAVAALLNAAGDAPYTPYVTPGQVVCMVQDVWDGGTYNVAGCMWDAQQVLCYLMSTYGSCV